MAYKKVSKAALDSALSTLEKSFGKNFAEKGLHESEYKAIPTGHDDLDRVLTRGQSGGGLYLGGICELFGGEGSGKTSLAMRTVGLAQKSGLNCAWFDAEHSFSPDLAELNGVDCDKLVYMGRTKGAGDKTELLNAGEVLHRIFQIIWSNAFSLVVLDSIAALMPERVADKDYDPAKKGMSELAREMSQILPKISSACAEKECTLICINQVRIQPGVIYGNPETTPGGRALKFFAVQRISVKKIGGKGALVTQTDEDGIEETIGHYARVTVAKNKKNEPCYDPLEVPIYYREYFPDDAKRCYDLARKLQVIKTNRGILTWKDSFGGIVAQIEGESNMLQFIRGLNDNIPKEAYLAQSCVDAGASEKNTKKKISIKIPSSIASLAVSVEVQKIITELKSKGANCPEVKSEDFDLDDEETV